MKQVRVLNHYAQEPSSAGEMRHFSLARHLSRYRWHASVEGGGLTVVAGLPEMRAEAIAELVGSLVAGRPMMGAANREHVVANYRFDQMNRKFLNVLEAARVCQ